MAAQASFFFGGGSEWGKIFISGRGKDHQKVISFDHFVQENAKRVGQIRARQLFPQPPLAPPSMQGKRKWHLRWSCTEQKTQHALTTSIFLHYYLLSNMHYTVCHSQVWIDVLVWKHFPMIQYFFPWQRVWSLCKHKICLSCKIFKNALLMVLHSLHDINL